MQNNKNESGNGLLWGGLSIALAGLVYWGYTQYQLLMKYCYKIKNIKFTKISYTNLGFKLDIAIRNFSNIKAYMGSIDIDVLINGIKITKIKSSKEMALKQNDISILSFDVNVNPKDILTTDFVKMGTLISTLLDKDLSKVNVTIRGKVGIKVGFISLRSLSIDMTMTMKEMLADDPNSFVCDII